MRCVYNPESRACTPKGTVCPGKPAIDMPGSSIMKKTAADSKIKGKEQGSTRNLLVNTCKGKDGGIYSD